MIELSNFDLSSIIGKLNQRVTKTDPEQGSEFEKILSAQLELSGIKSGIEFPILSQRGGSIGQKNSEEELSQLAIEGISDLSTLVHSNVDGRLLRDNELLPSQIIDPHDVGRIELTDVLADRVGGILPELSVVAEFVSEAAASETASPITFELQPADYFFDAERTEKNQIVKVSIPEPEVLNLGTQILLPEASIIKEIAEEGDLTSKIVDGVRQSENSPLPIDSNTPVFEFRSYSAQSVAYQEVIESGHELKARISPEGLELFALAIEDQNTAVFYGDREGNSTDEVLVQSAPRRGEGLIESKPGLLGATPIFSQVIQELYPVSKIDPQSEFDFAKAPAPPLQELPRSVLGGKVEPAVLDEPSVKVSQPATVTEEGTLRSRSDGIKSAVSEMTNIHFSHERQPNGQAHRQGISFGHRSESLESRNGPYIETLSGQRQVLVGGRPSRHAMVDLAGELGALARADEAPARPKFGRTDLSSSSTNRLAMTQESDLQSLKDQEGLVGLSREAPARPKLGRTDLSSSSTNRLAMTQESALHSLKNQEGLAGLSQEAQPQTRARLNKSRAAYSGIRQTGYAQAVDSRVSGQDIIKYISKAQEIENIPSGVKHEVTSEASVGRISDILSPSSENRGSVRSTAAILQPAEFIVPPASQEDPAIESGAKRAVSSSIQAELDLTGYESRRELLREELDKRVGQLIRSVSSQIKSGQTNELQIKLHPRELGIITFGVELLDGNDISVKILNASEEATKLVKEHWPSHWQDGGAKVSNLEAGDRAFSGNNSDPNSERKENRSGKGASEDGADSMKPVPERDLAQGLAESAHNIDITI